MQRIVNGFSVIMPTYNQGEFILRAIKSLFRQDYDNWQLIIVNDGSTDDTEQKISSYLQDTRILYLSNETNEGIGCSINKALEYAKYDYITYLPSDDYYYRNHLSELKHKFEENDEYVLISSGMDYEFNDSLSTFKNKNTLYSAKFYSVQLVQTAHIKISERWLTRKELITEDFFIMYWNKFIYKGLIGLTYKITCHWTMHDHQHHKILCEDYGGNINYYRRYYKIKHPLRVRISKYKTIDESELYKDFNIKWPVKPNSLKILIVGELSYNPERLVAFEQEGHSLFGMWDNKPAFSFNFVGSLPFGNIQDIEYDDNWIQNIQKVNPDIIYVMCNSGSIGFCHKIISELKEKKQNIPYVFHFKESPLQSLRTGEWKKLVNLYIQADGKIYLHRNTKEWFELFMPSTEDEKSFVMDLDIPNKEYFTNHYSSKISEQDGEIHTVVAGRIIGLNANDIKEFAKNKIHIHCYNESYFKAHKIESKKYLEVAPNHFHVHSHVPSKDWCKEFSKYDAGWLHCFNSYNGGELLKASWNDLNIPNRINVYAAAGIPVIQKDNTGNIVAMQEMLKQIDAGVFYTTVSDLTQQLKDVNLLTKLGDNIKANQHLFTINYYIK
ncbi:MAG: glycosyltransferase family 2 protein, partial [Clostridiales bacterium]|nr:glycosyltransferase family 2 protein [Clostridiales bacterium]